MRLVVEPIDAKPAPRGSPDDAAISDLVERLTKQLPDLSSEGIREAVCAEYDGYQHSKIRDFVPILVERAARRKLGETTSDRQRG